MELDIQSTKSRKIIDLRTLGFTDIQVLGKYNYTKSESKLPRHRHKNMIEICYCDKGVQYFEVNGEQHLVKGGDIFIHFPGELHGSGGHPEEKGILYWMIVNVQKETDISRLCRKLITINRRHYKGSSQAKKTLEDIYAAFAGKEDFLLKRIRLESILRIFLLQAIDCGLNDIDYSNDERVESLLNYMDAHITEKLSIASLAKKTNLSESRFKNFFKEKTGFTPADYIQRKKVEIALQKINDDPTISLSDLAYDLNFSSPQYFSTVVKKYTGSSPRSLKNYSAE